MTMKEIGEQLHIAESTVSKYETGKEEIKDLRLLIEWALMLKTIEPVQIACRSCPISSYYQVGSDSGCSCNKLVKAN